MLGISGGRVRGCLGGCECGKGCVGGCWEKQGDVLGDVLENVKGERVMC